jgi:diacylglycerol O-acyltransferase
MQRLSGSDALFLSLETPSWHQHIAGMTILDPSDCDDFSFAKAVERIDERMDLTPKFRWKLKTVPLDLDRPVWIEDTDFDLHRHIRRVGVPRPGGRHEVAEMLSEIMAYPLDRSIPLWQWWYLEGLSNDKVAMVLKFHHCLLDGVSGASLATVLMDLEPDAETPPIPEDAEVAGRDPSSWELLMRSAVPILRTPLRLARYGGETARRGFTMFDYRQNTEDNAPIVGLPKTRWNAKIGPRRSCAFASISMNDVKTIKKGFDVKVNDVVLAICAGALRGYLESHDELPESPLVAGVPISTRAADDTDMNNQIANMSVSLSTDIEDPVERLKQINLNSQSAKGMTEAMRAKSIQSLGETAPPLMLNLAIRALHGSGVLGVAPTVMNTVVSNVPGPPFPIYFAGARATGIYPGSVIMETMGLNITVLSYIDRLDIGLAADPELIPDLWDMADLFPKSLAELMKAGKLGKPSEVADAFA